MRRLDDVIPVPVSAVPADGHFAITPATQVSADPGLAWVAAFLGLPAAPSGGAIQFALGLDGPDESYELDISDSSVRVRAATPAGAFAAVQTLRQLISEGTLPAGHIADRPRFAYRGVMLDVARHFFTVDEVKAFIDAIVAFKINHLHLHLTDDQGWRLEIPGWPRLTEVSGASGTGVGGEGPGFYTRDHYTEIVSYAAERFVTIVPEIDMPGHVNAAQFAYPALTADGNPVPQRTDTEVGYSSLVADSETTYAFVEDVIREVAALTPGPFLHIGGDEAQATTPDDYRTFMSRVLPLVGKYGKRAVGWHEMANVELPETAVPQFWRTEPADDGTARAVAAGSQVIMSPADRTYLDMKYEPGFRLGLDWAGCVELDRAYDWDPADRLPGVPEHALLGVEAALWSETLRSRADVETMTFPRLPAIAEIAWSPREARDWPSFRRRVAAYAPRWRAEGTAYHPSPTVDWE
ncbi:family 20 glycosylhydrolase [Actinoplanes sp. NPDC051470]|uniref:family 20 glycosylhydrolase n=1 Tax=Actinoplanes sp. NPDC051470 TaxID=3157224 RepID=UPI00343F53C4